MADSTPVSLFEDPTSKASAPPLSPMMLGIRRFRKHRMAMFGFSLLMLLVIYISVAGVFSRGYCAPIKQDLTGEAWANCNDTSLKLQPPSADHIFGTDVIGRDIFARTIYGGQISLLIGISAAFLEVVLGALIGALAAYYGGWVDSLLMRFTEAMLNIPSLFLLIIGARFFGGSLPGRWHTSSARRSSPRSRAREAAGWRRPGSSRSGCARCSASFKEYRESGIVDPES